MFETYMELLRIEFFDDKYRTVLTMGIFQVYALAPFVELSFVYTTSLYAFDEPRRSVLNRIRDTLRSASTFLVATWHWRILREQNI